MKGKSTSNAFTKLLKDKNNYENFFKTYQELKNNRCIIDFYAEGDASVVFTTPNSKKLIKIKKIQQLYEIEAKVQETLSKIDFLDCIPPRKIIDNYIEVDKAIPLLDLYSEDHFPRKRQNKKLYKWKPQKPNWIYFNHFLNSIEDNELCNFGVLENKIVILDYDRLRHNFLLKHYKKIKKDRNALNNFLMENLNKNEKTRYRTSRTGA